MTCRKSISNVAVKLSVCAFVAGGLALVGCGTETIETPPEKKAEQLRVLNEAPDQGAKNKAGKSTGAPIKVQSIKQKLLNAPKE